MAVRVLQANLNGSDIERIKRELTFHPKKQGPPSGYASAPEPPLKAFQADNRWLLLPKYYGQKNFLERIITNHQTVGTQFKFEGNLLNELDRNQVEVAPLAIKTLQSKGSVFLALRTGFGKTCMATNLAAECQGRTLILVPPLTSLLTQWPKAFRQFTDASVWVVGQEEQPPEPQVTITMTTRFDTIPADFLKTIRTLVVDEAHQFTTQIRLNCFLGLEPQYIIFATATPQRDNGLFPAIEAFNGPDKIIRISTKPFEVTMCHTGIQINPKMVTRGRGRFRRPQTDFNDLCQQLAQHKTRNRMIIDLVELKHREGYKILVMAKLRNHVKLLYEGIGRRGLACDYMSGTKSSYEDNPILIGTISKIGTGFDEEMACSTEVKGKLNLLILVCSIKNRTTLEQVVGRVLRSPDPTVIQLSDDNKVIERHCKSNLPWYRKRKAIIQQSNIHDLLQSWRQAKMLSLWSAWRHGDLQNLPRLALWQIVELLEWSPPLKHDNQSQITIPQAKSEIESKESDLRSAQQYQSSQQQSQLQTKLSRMMALSTKNSAPNPRSVGGLNQKSSPVSRSPAPAPVANGRSGQSTNQISIQYLPPQSFLVNFSSPSASSTCTAQAQVQTQANARAQARAQAQVQAQANARAQAQAQAQDNANARAQAQAQARAQAQAQTQAQARPVISNNSRRARLLARRAAFQPQPQILTRPQMTQPQVRTYPQSQTTQPRPQTRHHMTQLQSQVRPLSQVRTPSQVRPPSQVRTQTRPRIKLPVRRAESVTSLPQQQPISTMVPARVTTIPMVPVQTRGRPQTFSPYSKYQVRQSSTSTNPTSNNPVSAPTNRVPTQACYICRSQPVVYTARPCGHKYCCRDCLSRVESGRVRSEGCRLCRRPVTHFT